MGDLVSRAHPPVGNRGLVALLVALHRASCSTAIWWARSSGPQECYEYNYCAMNNIMGLLVKHKLYRLMLRAEMEEVNLCVGCAEDITASRIKRKLTGGVANVVGIIVEIFEEVLPVGSTLDTCKLLNSYVCRPCFRSMERILKLREEGASAFRDACNKARGSIHCIPLVHQDAADPGSDEEDSLHPPPAKRQRLRSDEEDSLHPPSAKCQCLFIPVIDSSISEKSPAVSV